MQVLLRLCRLADCLNGDISQIPRTKVIGESDGCCGVTLLDPAVILLESFMQQQCKVIWDHIVDYL